MLYTLVLVVGLGTAQEIRLQAVICPLSAMGVSENGWYPKYVFFFF